MVRVIRWAFSLTIVALVALELGRISHAAAGLLLIWLVGAWLWLAEERVKARRS